MHSDRASYELSIFIKILDKNWRKHLCSIHVYGNKFLLYDTTVLLCHLTWHVQIKIIEVETKETLLVSTLISYIFWI